MIRTQAVVIGGGLSGSSCAISLARQGIDALVLDRGHDARPKVCGAFLSPGGVRSLDRLGLLTEVRDAGAVRVDNARIAVGSMDAVVGLEEPGMGISRRCLDSIVAARATVEQGRSVEHISARRNGGGFVVRTTDSIGNGDQIHADVVVDAAGKLSRFTRRRATRRYGVQFEEHRSSGNVVDFGFFDWGYGGSVSVEGGRTNSCFLVDASEVPEYVRRGGCTIAGPIAYDRVSGNYLAIGDASGMIDPFCGEGMRHALDTGQLAGNLVAEGIRQGLSYETIRENYDREWRLRWSQKRRLASVLRWILEHPSACRTVFQLGGNSWSLTRLVQKLWS